MSHSPTKGKIWAGALSALLALFAALVVATPALAAAPTDWPAFTSAYPVTVTISNDYDDGNTSNITTDSCAGIFQGGEMKFSALNSILTAAKGSTLSTVVTDGLVSGDGWGAFSPATLGTVIVDNSQAEAFTAPSNGPWTLDFSNAWFSLGIPDASWDEHVANQSGVLANTLKKSFTIEANGYHVMQINLSDIEFGSSIANTEWQGGATDDWMTINEQSGVSATIQGLTIEANTGADTSGSALKVTGTAGEGGVTLADDVTVDVTESPNEDITAVTITSGAELTNEGTIKGDVDNSGTLNQDGTVEQGTLTTNTGGNLTLGGDSSTENLNNQGGAVTVDSGAEIKNYTQGPTATTPGGSGASGIPVSSDGSCIVAQNTAAVVVYDLSVNPHSWLGPFTSDESYDEAIDHAQLEMKQNYPTDRYVIYNLNYPVAGAVRNGQGMYAGVDARFAPTFPINWYATANKYTASPTFLQWGFEGNYDAKGAVKAINDALGNKPVNGNYVNEFGIPSTAENVMWAVLQGDPDNLVSVDFYYANKAGQPTRVFGNVAEPEKATDDNMPGVNGNTFTNYVQIDDKGYGVVWFCMDDYDGTAPTDTLTNPSVQPLTTAGGAPNASNAETVGKVADYLPTPANYSAVAWTSGAYGTAGPNPTANTVPVNGVQFGYINQSNGDYTSLSAYLKNLYGEAGSTVTLPSLDTSGLGLSNFPSGTINAWTDTAGTYPVGTSYTFPQPSGFLPVELTASNGATVNLVPNPTAGDGTWTHFPTGSVSTAFTSPYVDSEGEPWTMPSNNQTGNNAPLVIGANANRTLPELPGLTTDAWAQGAGMSADAQAAYANVSVAFAGWYSWTPTGGYQLWQEGDTLPQYGTLTLYPLFAPVDVDWQVASEVAPADVPGMVADDALYYNFHAYNAPGQNTPYTLTVSANEDALADAIGAESVQTSTAASALLDFFVHEAISEPYEETPVPSEQVSGLNNVVWDNSLIGYLQQPYTGVGEDVNGVKFEYTGESTGENTFNVYVPAGFQNYRNYASIYVTDVEGLNNPNDPSISGKETYFTTLNVSVANVLVEVQPPTSGTVAVQPASGTDAGMMTITAVPADGYAFDHWSISQGQFPEGLDPNAISITVPAGSGVWVANFVPTSTSAGTVNVYRLLNPDTQEHLYTIDQNEYNALINNYGWEGENVAWVAPENSATPIYRLSFPEGGHLYTTSLTEYNYLDSHGWTGEGTAMYSASATNNVPIYRLFKPGVPVGFSHLWTADFNEYTVLAARYGWNQESVAFYAISAPGM